MHDNLRAEIEQAIWHVDRAKEIIAHQLDVVNERGEAGHYATAAAEHTLGIFIRTLRLLKNLEHLLHAEAFKQH